MERKGSGFGKIIGGYEFQINYDESKKPTFRSDRYQFTVVMPNLNYNVPQDVPRIKDLDIIQFVGRGCNGHWEIIKKEKVISQQNSDTPQA